MLRPPYQETLETDLKRVRHDYECRHPHVEIRKLTARSGQPMYRHQCTRCGGGIGSWVKLSELPQNRVFADWDENLREGHWRKLHDAIDQVRHRYLDPMMLFDYASYLKSERWRAKRRAVLRRANGTCEACGQQPSVEVHHLTYRNIGHEYLWELAAVCSDCHDRLHPDKRLP